MKTSSHSVPISVERIRSNLHNDVRLKKKPLKDGSSLSPTESISALFAQLIVPFFFYLQLHSEELHNPAILLVPLS